MFKDLHICNLINRTLFNMISSIIATSSLKNYEPILTAINKALCEGICGIILSRIDNRLVIENGIQIII